MSFMETNYWWTHSLTHWLCYFSVSIPSEARYAWQDNLRITFSTSKQVWHSCGRLCSESPFYSAEQSFTNEEAQSCCCWTDQHWTSLFFLPTLAHPVTPKLLWVQIYLGEDVPLYLMRMVNGHADNNVGSERIKDLQFRSNLPASSSLSY